MSSFKRNIVTNYASQIYLTIINMIVAPIYISYLGVEAYGLVGFFLLLQTCFQLLDIGLSPTMSRQAAEFLGGQIDAFSLRSLLRVLEKVFIGIAILAALGIFLSSSYIAHKWLVVHTIPLNQVENCIRLMAFVIGLRWICSLYRGVVNGLEQQVWLNAFNMIFGSAKFIFVISIFVFWSTSVAVFFTYQMILALFETVVLVLYVYKILPKIDNFSRVVGNWSLLRGVLNFSLSMAFVNVIWVLMTQADKVILSRALPLVDYGCFSLVVIVASGITLLTGPLSVALIPRLTRLSAADNETQFIKLYRNATQLICLITISIVVSMAFFSEQVLFAWTGDHAIVKIGSVVLTLYSLGNGVLALGAFPYYLQFAKGNLQLHILGNILFAIIFIPTLFIATSTFGMLGAGYSWLALNCLYFLLWIPIVHRKFLPGMHYSWLTNDIAMIVIPVVIVASIINCYVSWSEDRIILSFQLIGVSCLFFAIAAIQSSFMRSILVDYGRKWQRVIRGVRVDGKNN